MKIQKFKTPDIIIRTLTAPDQIECISQISIQRLLESHLIDARKKLEGIEVLVYPPDTRITISENRIAQELLIFRDTLDGVRMQVANILRQKGFKVILTNQPLDNLTATSSSEKWLSEKYYPEGTPRIKTRAVNSADLLTEIPTATVDHPNILAEYRQRISETSIVVRRRFLDGITSLDQEAHLPLKEKIRLLIEALSGNMYLHFQGLIHCDVKPSNIFIKTNSDGEMTAMIGDLEGVLYRDTENSQDIPIYTRQFHEETYFKRKRDDQIPIDESRDSFAWAITIAYVLASKEDALDEKQLPTITDWFSSQNFQCPYFCRLIDLCQDGLSQDRAARPTLEQYKEALTAIMYNYESTASSK
jgi:hypothetical protein